MGETKKDLKERFWNWKDALESRGLRVNIKKNKSNGKLVGSRTAQKQDRFMWTWF